MWKHVRAILLLPGVMTVLIPAIIVCRSGTDTFDLGTRAPVVRIAIGILGIACIGIELVLFGATVYLLATRGRGTLAPWNPTSRLVVEGAYLHVRNPMISSVLAILLGESLAGASLPLFLWLLMFAAINMVYIPLFEEPGLLGRFGPDYDEYRRHVPRWIPRLRPWIKKTDTPN